MTTEKHASARRLGYAIAVAIAALLGGCVSETEHPEHRPHPVARREESFNAAVADIVKAAQEKALARMQGGEAGMLIPWNEPKLGLEGTLTWDKAVTMTYSCRRYRQSLFLGSEVLSGALTACPQGDGSWKIVKTPS